MNRVGNKSLIGLALFLYILFLAAGAARQLIVSYLDWNSYFLIKFSIIALSIYFLFKLFDSKKELVDISSIRQSYPNGDPLLLLRALLCFMVLMQHGFGITFASVNIKTIIWEDALWLMLPSAWVGVWGFFVLSGYVIGKGFFYGTYPLSRSGLFGFYKNRLIKIYPGYIAILLGGSYLLDPSIFDLKNLWMLASMGLFEYDGAYPLNPVGALWSIATEMQFYLIAPLAAYLIIVVNQNFKNNLYNLVLIVSLYAVLLSYRLISFIDGGFYWKTAVMTPVIGNVDLFFGGMVMAYMMKNIKLRISRVDLGVAICIILYIIGAVFTCSILSGKDWLWILGYFGPTFTGILVLLMITIFELSKNDRSPGKLANLVKKITPLGLLTYEVYLLHDPVQRVLRLYMPEKISLGQSLLGLSVSLVITYILAYYFSKFFESIFIKYRYVRP